MFHFVYYSFEETPEGRGYIGKHSTNNPNDGYLGSFKDPSFKPSAKIILEHSNSARGAIVSEIRWQKAFKVVEDPHFVNRSYQSSEGFTYSWTGRKRTDEDKKKKSAAARGKPKSQSHRDNMSKARKGATLTEDHKRKIGLAGKGRVVTEETREKIRRSKEGKPQTDSHKQSLSLVRKGKKCWNNGELETQSHNPPDPGWKRGRVPKGPVKKLAQGSSPGG
jgi:hypothetical protein